MKLMEQVHTDANHFPNPPEPVRSWITVADAVARCSELGLSRTPKTVRKWAARSFANPDSPDIAVLREDTGNGFRWSIELSSLDRKIAEELEFERRKQSEPDLTGANRSEPRQTSSPFDSIPELPAHTREPVRTDQHQGVERGVEKELRAQLEQKNAEIEFLRDELKHRRETDKALATVIDAFKLNAETTREQLNSGSRHPQPRSWEGQHQENVHGANATSDA